MTLVSVRCEECGENFLVKPYRKDSARFCSRACGGRLRMRETLNTPLALAARSSAMLGNKFAAGRAPNATSFRPGHSTWNRGVKGLQFSPSTQFKKGRKSENWLPVGSETVRCDKNGKRRAWVKTAEPNVWRERSIVVWEQEHGGRLPEGYVVHHRDRNTLNDDISNLEAMTRAEHIAEHRHELRSLPPVAKQEALL